MTTSVAVRDVAEGSDVVAVAMDTGTDMSVTTRSPIPLGHKIALKDLPEGSDVRTASPIEPVVKVTGNPLTAGTMSEHIDLDVSGLLTREYDLAEAGRRLMDVLVRTANGRLTAAEALGHRELVMTKLYRSA